MEKRKKYFHFLKVARAPPRSVARTRFISMNAILHIIYGKIQFGHIPSTEIPTLIFFKIDEKMSSSAPMGVPKWPRARDMRFRAPKFLYQKILQIAKKFSNFLNLCPIPLLTFILSFHDGFVKENIFFPGAIFHKYLNK